VIGSPYLHDRDRYERRVDGRVDNTHDDAFTHVVRIEDDDRALELAAVCTPPPAYEVRSATARVLAGDVDPALAARAGGLAGMRLVSGLRRRVTEALGDAPGAGLLADAAIEVARLARQASKVPAAVTAAIAPGDARAFWRLDTTSWADLPGSCFAYSDAGRALVESRPVTTSASATIYSPPPGARGVFRRRKLSRLVRTGPRLDLFQSMHDDVHGFDLHYEVDLRTGTIVAADSVTSRLPYRGVCDEPQRRIGAMVGERVDALLRRRAQALLGGETGCAQLFDLTADVLGLLEAG
jgi:Protein of unknown function (DUF2889)